MLHGYSGWKDELGHWQFQITINVGEARGLIITSIDNEERLDDRTSLTEAKFRQIMADTFDQSQAFIDTAISRVKEGKTGKFHAS